ncbi:MAG: dephospho-CoA kinase [Phycisphaerales bacterium]|nr:dephospho-CoA kinase [Phycisphaerales bacterium]
MGTDSAKHGRASSGRSDRFAVIGLVGGIGAGKSLVARAFCDLGCAAADADALAIAALDRPDVRSELIGWWGERVIGCDDRVDRKVVAGIVFADPQERRRLEALIHPIVTELIRGLLAEAQTAGVQAFIIDAPLLVEAGLDDLCDAVVFVEAPRDVREKRVRESRGWGPDELDLREKTQLPLAEKRRRSQYTVQNDGDPADVARRVEAVFNRICQRTTGLVDHPESGCGDAFGAE